MLLRDAPWPKGAVFRPSRDGFCDDAQNITAATNDSAAAAALVKTTLIEVSEVVHGDAKP